MIFIFFFAVQVKQIFQGTHVKNWTPTARNFSAFQLNCNEINESSVKYTSIDIKTKTCFFSISVDA